jgi:hypothetical protein
MQTLASVAKFIRLDRTRKGYKVALRGDLVMRSRFCGLAVVALFVVAGLAPNAFADSFTYTTAGCFTGGSCTSTGSSMSFTDSSTSAVDATLSFNNVTTPITTGSGVPVSLGSFNFSLANPLGISNSPFDFGFFTLDLEFTDPTGTAGNPFFAAVAGNVLGNAGGATITLIPDPQVFTYPGGSFLLDLSTDPVQVSSSNPNVELDATIVSMPEGSGLAMLGLSGLVVFGAMFKKLSVRSAPNAC